MVSHVQQAVDEAYNSGFGKAASGSAAPPMFYPAEELALIFVVKRPHRSRVWEESRVSLRSNILCLEMLVLSNVR